MIRRNALALLLLFGSRAHPGASLDFLNIPLTPHSAWCGGHPRSVADAMDGLWLNPAFLGALAHPVNLSFGLNAHLDTTLLSGGGAFQFGAWTIGFGGSGLLLGNVMGDLQTANDAGRLVPAGSVRLAASLAWALDRSVKLPFEWRLGLGFQLAAETLDQTQLSAQFLQAGLAFVVPIGSLVRLGLSVDGRQLPLASQAKVPLSLGVGLGGALSFEVALPKSFDLMAAVEGTYHELNGLGLNLGLEGRFKKLFYVRVGSSFGANPSFSVGGGITLTLPGPSALGVDLVTLPGRVGVETLAHISYSQ